MRTKYSRIDKTAILLAVSGGTDDELKQGVNEIRNSNKKFINLREKHVKYWRKMSKIAAKDVNGQKSER